MLLHQFLQVLPSSTLYEWHYDGESVFYDRHLGELHAPVVCLHQPLLPQQTQLYMDYYVQHYSCRAQLRLLPAIGLEMARTPPASETPSYRLPDHLQVPLLHYGHLHLPL